MRLRISLLLVLVTLLVLGTTLVVAQEDAETEPPATEDVIIDVDNALEDDTAISEAVATAQAAAAKAEEAITDVDEGVSRAFDLLGLFEAIAFLVTVVGGVAAVLGASRLFSAQNELAESRKRFEEEIQASRKRIDDEAAQKEEDFTNLRGELLRELNRRMTVVMITHDLGFVSQHVKSVVCVGHQVVIHPTSEITGEVIADLYGADMRLVRHDHRCSEEGHQTP